MQLTRAIGIAIGIGLGLGTAHAQPVALPPPPGGDAPIDPYATGAGAGTGAGTGTGTGTETGTETETETESDDDSAPITGTARLGLYTDSDHTRVYRALASIARAWDTLSMNAGVDVDVVTSASLDVKTSPLGAIDVVTGASGHTSTEGGTMSDRRLQATAGGGWNDGAGKTANLALAAAHENDYNSISAGINGSYDVLERSTTLLGGVTVTRDWIASVLDPNIDENKLTLGWAAGAARVLTASDAVRLRYDGQVSDGYQASPYRNVRFGDWVASPGMYQITFSNTIGSADGLPEHEPDRRVSHAATLEWVHSLAADVGLHPSVRASHDSWGVNSLTANLDLRVAGPSWRLLAGYRFYLQSGADFFTDKYVMDPSAYTYYTADKDLGDERGHQLRFAYSFVVRDSDSMSDARMMLDVQVELARYSYPGFTLLPQRDDVFASVGLSWEPAAL